MSELKPCPFCGGEAFHRGYDVVWCKKCSAEAHVDDWNRRPDAPSAGEWMPIETAPKDGHILAWKDGWGPTEAHLEWGDDEDYQGWVATHQDCDFSPTHWMPLPAPPQADGGEG